LRQIMRL